MQLRERVKSFYKDTKKYLFMVLRVLTCQGTSDSISGRVTISTFLLCLVFKELDGLKYFYEIYVIA